MSALAFLVLISLQYILVANTYRLKNEEFHFEYSNSLYDNYEKCIDKGVMYNDAHLVVDTMLFRFRKMIDEAKNEAACHDLKDGMLTDFVTILQKHDDLDAFLAEYQEKINLNTKLEYAIVLRHLGIFLNDKKEWVVFDEKLDGGGKHILGHLKDYNDNNNIVHAHSAVNQRCLLVYSLYVDTPERQKILLTQMTGIFVLSLLSILVTLLTFIFTIRNWLKQKQLSDMKSDFINNINHELKTPLATIIIANKSLQNAKIRQNETKALQTTDIIERQTKRLQHLIEQVLELTQQEQEMIHLKLEEVNMNVFLQTIVNDFSTSATNQDVIIQTNFLAKNDKVAIDKFHFTTAIFNLLDNALKYNENEVLISIATKNLKNAFFIEIKDNGVGMDKQTQKYIFDKFYRGQKDNIYHQKGLGLGLFYVKKSIDSHGGKIEMSSKIGQGSSFSIYLNKTM